LAEAENSCSGKIFLKWKEVACVVNEAKSREGKEIYSFIE
jgi:hypothetical protein